jgi:hypothetical protein
MARIPLFSRRQAVPAAAPSENGAPSPQPRRPLPHPGQLRRERRALLRVREERIRDLGGLMLEMYRRDHFRQDLLVERCAELVALEERLAGLDALLAVAMSARRTAPAARCACGAPLLWGTHFCANCGRPVGASAVAACRACAHALAADATFCAACGTKVEAAEAEPAAEPAAAPEPAPAAAEES